ncbi:MAG: M60 family metallopeptidase [Planctomycetota bacterium]|nr:M60 family metallopeptidase [Planctomycetota bacterium]
MKPLLTALSVVVALFVPLVSPSRAAPQEEAAKLLEDVRTVERVGIPGPIAVFGDKAFPIVTGGHGGAQAALIAGGRIGSGRVLVFGHNGYAGPAAKRPGETAALMKNLLVWTAKSKAKALKVGTLGGMFGGLMAETGYEVVALPNGPEPEGVAKLAIIGCAPLSLSDEETDWLIKYVAGGGAVICGDTPWGWLQGHPNERVEERPGQRLLAQAGLAYADGYTEPTSDNGQLAANVPDPLVHAGRALELMLALEAGKATATDAQLAQAQVSLQLALRWMPKGDVAFRERLEKLVKAKEASLVVSESQPMKRSNALGRALLAIQVEMLRSEPIGKVRAHASAADFPGDVDAPAQVLSAEIDASLGGWHSTGAYARPGAKVELQLPAEALGRGFALRIGCHDDTLWHLDTWKRVPAITLEVPANERTTLAANPFGGPVYVVVPDGCTLGKLKVQLRGVVPAPLFVLGRTTLEEWRDEQRTRPAPWAELSSRKLGISLPSAAIRSLDDPKALMEFWDRVLDAEAELVGVPKARPRPERFVCDRQISAGYMHSGYPVMTHLDAAEHVVALDNLRHAKDVWGFVHELGHNLQRPEWTFDGTGEVTNNVIGLYAIERCCDQRGEDPGHEGVSNPPSVEAYVARGAKFDEWKNDPFLALTMYRQLREAFGWEPFQRVFAEYRALGRNERPQGEEEKRDEWMRRMSEATGKNLGPFFQAWGVPTSEKARRGVERLAPWMPAGLESKAK